MNKINDNQLNKVSGGFGSSSITIDGKQVDMNMTIGELVAQYPQYKNILERKLAEYNLTLDSVSSYTLKTACFFLGGASNLQKLIDEALAENSNN